MLRGGHEPGTRLVRNARLGPPLERGNERVLREIELGTDVDGGRARATYEDGVLRIELPFAAKVEESKQVPISGESAPAAAEGEPGKDRKR
jgi:hypothetical protein